MMTLHDVFMFACEAVMYMWIYYVCMCIVLSYVFMII